MVIIAKHPIFQIRSKIIACLLLHWLNWLILDRRKVQNNMVKLIPMVTLLSQFPLIPSISLVPTSLCLRKMPKERIILLPSLPWNLLSLLSLNFLHRSSICSKYFIRIKREITLSHIPLHQPLILQPQFPLRQWGSSSCLRILIHLSWLLSLCDLLFLGTEEPLF